MAKTSKELKIIEVDGEALIFLDEPIQRVNKSFPFSDLQDEKNRQYMASIQEELKERMNFMNPMGGALPFDIFIFEFKKPDLIDKEEDDSEKDL